MKKYLCAIAATIHILAGIYSFCHGQEDAEQEYTATIILDDRVEIKDKSGSIVNIIPINSSITYPVIGLPLDAKDKTYRKVEQEVYYNAYASKSGRFVVLYQNTCIMSVFDENGVKHRLNDIVGTLKVIAVDAVTGKTLWQKQFAEGIMGGASEVHVSRNAGTIIFPTGNSLYRPGQPDRITYVFNNAGNTILSIPSKEYDYYVRDIYLSENGKYAAFDGYAGNNKVTIFINVNNKKRYIIEDNHAVFSITDDGIATVDNTRTSVFEKIDLKKYIDD